MVLVQLFHLLYLEQKVPCRISNVEVMYNDNVEARLYHDNNKAGHGQMSQTVLIKMSTGDKVWIRTPDQNGIHSWARGRYTHFVGYLIMPY